MENEKAVLINSKDCKMWRVSKIILYNFVVRFKILYRYYRMLLVVQNKYLTG